MPTGKKYFNATTKRVLSLEDMRDNVIDYMRESDRSVAGLIHPDPIVFGTAKTNLAADVASDVFKLDAATVCSDGDGNRLDTAETHSNGHSEYFEGVPFENTTAVDYDVALHYASKPTGIQLNPRTVLPEYDAWEDTIGFSADPDSVVDNGDGTMTITINSVLEDNRDNSGRTVLVWKKLPHSDALSTAIAIEEITSTFVSTDNKIVTTGSLGQTNISTTASDYTVLALGPVVLADTSLTSLGGYVFIGTITGNSGVPTVFDMSNQDLTYSLFGITPDISRYEASSSKYKVSVSANSTDTLTNQIQVKDQSDSVVFSVKGDGGVVVDSSTSDYGVIGQTSKSDGVGLFGHSKSLTGTNYGVFGRSESTDGVGVWGYAPLTTGNTFGVIGTSGSTLGTGVYGEGKRYGVHGLSTVSGGYAVYAQNTAASGTAHGVYAKCVDSTSGIGVYGEGIKYGVHGLSTVSSGYGVYAQNTAESGTAHGVYAKCLTSTLGIGVYGEGKRYGVQGFSNGSEGRGVYAKNTSASGTVYGVYAECIFSTLGIGVYGEAKLYGVHGLSTVSAGIGVYGKATAATGAGGKFECAVDGAGAIVATTTGANVNCINAEAAGYRAVSMTTTDNTPVKGLLSFDEHDHPSNPDDGDVWYTDNRLFAHVNGKNTQVTATWANISGSSSVFAVNQSVNVASVAVGGNGAYLSITFNLGFAGLTNYGAMVSNNLAGDVFYSAVQTTSTLNIYGYDVSTGDVNFNDQIVRELSIWVGSNNFS